MTHHNDGRGSTNNKKGKRGTVRNDKRLSALSQRRSGEKADWQGCSPDKMQAVVSLITSIGGAVTYGTSRDGGAYSVTLLLDGDRETLWFNGDADLDEELGAVIDVLDAMRE